MDSAGLRERLGWELSVEQVRASAAENGKVLERARAGNTCTTHLREVKVRMANVMLIMLFSSTTIKTKGK